MQGEKLENILEWIDGTELYEKRMIEKATHYENIIIFGAGIGGGTTYELLIEYGCEKKIKAFVDNNQEKIGTSYMGLPVISPVEIVPKFLSALILVSSTAFDVIKKQLLELGINEKDFYYFQPAGISLSSNNDIKFVKENIKKFEAVYQQLMDEKSKTIYRCLLNYRITKKLSWLEKMNDLIDKEEIQYFDKGILQNYIWENGFVDAGAYTGDTIRNFFKYFPNWKGYYYCLEAGENIYENMCKSIECLKQKDQIIPFNYAVWDTEGELRFDTTSFGNGGGSRVSETGNMVKCSSLDNLLRNAEINFIKMDIEGAERKALLGAKTIIQLNKPILAVCIYHKPEDFFDIPLLINDILKDEYEFYVRQYRYGQSETVLYAMPKSRKM